MKNTSDGAPLAPPTTAGHLDLKARAHEEMEKSGFLPDFEPAVQQEVQNILQKIRGASSDSAKDLRSLLWSSIDNSDSKDLDQLEYCERNRDNTIRTVIAIADVDSLVLKGSAIDKHANTNTTSIYTGIVTYPMLPSELSFDLTSLVPNKDRQVIIIDLIIDLNGNVTQSSIYKGLVSNKAKLDYITVGKWLETGGDAPEQISNVTGLAQQLLLQQEVKERIRKQRKEQGSLSLNTIEAIPVIVNGNILDLDLLEENPARELIENFMIAGNVAVSHFLEGNQLPSIRRIVKTPERWDKIVEVAATYKESLPKEPNAKALAIFLIKRKEADPVRFPDLSLTIVKLLGRGEYTVESPGQKDEGHFALAVRDYTHATAPNRRYPDLITQRLIKAAIFKKPQPYTIDELQEITAHCTERENAAKKVERTMGKIEAAVLLSKHIGQVYDGIVTGVTDGGVFARIFKPPVEGKLVENQKGLDVGDKVKLKLVSTDPERAFIDFARVNS